MFEWEKDEEMAVEGGRRGECVLDRSESGPGTVVRFVNDAERGDGREGDEANALSGIGERAKPGDVPPVGPDEGGPIGSRSGDEAIRCAGGDCSEDDSADRMGTGLAADPESTEPCRWSSAPLLSRASRGDSDFTVDPPSRSFASSCAAFLFFLSMDMCSPGRT